MYVLSWIFFGALTGWIAGLIVNKRGEGCIVNTALGLVGALVGGWLFRSLTGFHYEAHGFIISTFVAVIGAIIVLFIYYAITGSRTLR
ncbi:MAG TPA: GlsB/YeaQ/YmgE family stress response membrane protein [Rhizomicrobium sp.]